MKNIILALALLLGFYNISEAGSAVSRTTKQTQIPYEECINIVYFDEGSLYKASNATVVERKKNIVILKHTSAAGTSHYEAEESRNITKEEAVFETKMVKNLDGTLKNQKTTIRIKRVAGKALITITMEANVEHLFATQNAVKKQLDSNIQNILSEIEKAAEKHF